MACCGAAACNFDREVAPPSDCGTKQRNDPTHRSSIIFCASLVLSTSTGHLHLVCRTLQDEDAAARRLRPVLETIKTMRLKESSSASRWSGRFDRFCYHDSFNQRNIYPSRNKTTLAVYLVTTRMPPTGHDDEIRQQPSCPPKQPSPHAPAACRRRPKSHHTNPATHSRGS